MVHIWIDLKDRPLGEMRKHHGCMILAILLWVASTPCMARPLEEAPFNIQAALIIKLLAFNKNVNQGGDLVCYVIGAPKFAQTMEPAMGRSIGKSRLVAIKALDRVPETPPSGPAVLYVGQHDLVEPALAYCQKNQILSMTGVPKLMDKGIALRVGVEHRKPAVLLSSKLSAKEGVLWDSKVYLIASDE